VKATVSILGVPGARPPGATVSLGGRGYKTDAKGRATLRARFITKRVVRANASLAGFRRVTAPLSAG
jgi:hypothetical protein